ncbi:MAG: hypothetical protein Kow0059_18780 [Candidatus Sumerlaeia bacterium]
MRKVVLLLSVLTLAAAISYAAAPLSFDTQWKRLMRFNGASDDVRDLAVSKDGQYIVVINRTNTTLKVHSGFTGLDKVRIEDVSTSGITPGNYKLINGAFSGDGALFVCSLDVVAGHQLYYWPNIDADPIAIGQPESEPRLGDALDVIGNVADNSVKVIISGNNAGTHPLVYTTTDGGSTWNQIALANTVQATDIHWDSADDGTFWSTGVGLPIRKHDATGAVIQTISDTDATNAAAIATDNRGFLYAIGVRTDAKIRVYDKATGTLLLTHTDDLILGGFTSGVANGSGSLDVFYSAAGVPNIIASSERNGAARYYLGSTITVDPLGGGYPNYTTIQSAITSYAGTNENTTATQPLIISIAPNGGTPYDEVLTLRDTDAGTGDIVGDLVMKSSDPNTNPIILVRLNPSTPDDGFYIYQSVNDVTFKGLTFAPSLVSQVTDDLLKLDETSANAPMNWFAMIDCILTDVKTGGVPQITTKADALNPPAPSAYTSGINAGDELIKCWGDAGESRSYWFESTVSYNSPSSAFRIYTSGNAGEETFINNSLAAYNRFDNGGFYISSDAGVGLDYHRVSGDNVKNGPLSCTATINSQWHGIYSPTSSSVGAIIKVENFLAYTTSAYDTNNNARGYSGGSGAHLALLQDVIFNVPSVGVVDALLNPAAYPAVWNRVSILCPTNALLGVGTPTSTRTITNCIFAGAGTKFSPASGEVNNLSNCGFPTSGPWAIGSVGTVTTNTDPVDANPIFVGVDGTQATFLDVRSGAYTAKGTGGSDLSGGADFIGDAADGVPIVITEVLDGPLTGGLPKFFEITNVGTSAVDLSTLDAVAAFNGSPTYTQRTQLSGTLNPGESYVIASESATYQSTYGVPPDIVSGAASHNGDDVMAIVLTGTNGRVDVYGELGVDGTGTAWECLDTRAYRKTPASPKYDFDVNDWVVNPIDDNDGETASFVVQHSNPGYFDNNMQFASQIGVGGDLDDPTTPTLTYAPSSNDILTSWGLTFSAPVRGLHVSATGGLAVLTDGIDVGPNSLDGLLFDANGDGIPSGLEVDFTSLTPYGVQISQINSWSRNPGKDARVYQNIHIYLDTTNDATFNPTFYGEVTTGGKGQTNSTNDWTAAYITDARGNLGDTLVYGVRLDFYSVTDAGNGYRAEGTGAGGSIVKEIDIFGTPLIPPTQVPDWIMFE